MTLAVTILQVLVGVVIILMVLFQSGKNQGLGVIGGAADTFLAKSKAKSLDAKLARATKWVGAVFIILTLVRNILSIAGVLCVCFAQTKRGGRPLGSRPPLFMLFCGRYRPLCREVERAPFTRCGSW